MNLVVYTDYTYRKLEGDVYAERAFALFLDELSHRLGSLTLIGRLDPRPGRARYKLGDDVTFAPLPFYETITRPWQAWRAIAGSIQRFWRALDGADATWLLGPHPVALLFAVAAVVRRRTVILGVRQDTGTYMRTRHPDRKWMWAAGWVLERLWRLIALRAPVIVVGPEAARQYHRSPRKLDVAISLIRAADITDVPSREDWDAETLEILSVGRLDAEKNPVLMADVLKRLLERDPRWRLNICGEGHMAEALCDRLEELGVVEQANLMGYVPLDAGLLDAYRSNHALLHVSWSEGLPQVFFEAFAAGLPSVATDVGGIKDAIGEAVELIQAGDAEVAAQALERLRDDPERRAELIARGFAQAHAHTVEVETARVADFLVRAARWREQA